MSMGLLCPMVLLQLLEHWWGADCRFQFNAALLTFQLALPFFA